MVKRYRVSNGLVTGGQTLFDLVNLDVVLASDYDALASDLVAEKAIGTTAMYSAIERDVTIESMQADLDEAEARIRELEAALRTIAENEDCRYASCGVAAREILGLTLETACEYGDACTLKYPHDKTAHVPETMGEHPGGGPCIHVWALTNRSAVENGKCELCGNSVETVVEHTSVCRCGHSDASHVRYVGECHFSDAIGQCICRSFTPKIKGDANG